ncbi:MAG: hypothetical protein E2579_27610 [Pseudomonas sp.]|nr:hypothetical protein [Pseudomonas sp.]MPT21458.1 hypothetical protein [Pseudomonas sp.]
MAAKIRGLGRLLLALTLMGWGQFGFASTELVYFEANKFGESATGRFATANAACMSIANGYPGFAGAGGQCYLKQGGVDYVSGSWRRLSIQCEHGAIGLYCNDPPEPEPDCSSTSGQKITAAQSCTYSPALKTYVCEDQIQQGGCLYTGGAGRKCVADLTGGTAICTGDFYGSGQPAGSGDEACTEESCTPPSDPNVPPAEEQCVTNGNVTVCHNPQNPGCGSVNGVDGCFQEKPGCGTFNGTYQCVDADKPQKNCGYYNGKLTCTDPKDPTKVIPDTSPDHPKNGGNADGNENNDPKAPGQAGTNPQGSDEGATNEAIGELGDSLGEKIDKTNSLLDGIRGVLDGMAEGLDALTDGLLGDEYDGSGDGDGDAEGVGSEAGSELAQSLTDAMNNAQEEQLVDDELTLDQLARDIDGVDFFGDNSQVAALLNFADELLPSHSSCVGYVISLSLDRYTADIVLPVCRIAAIKPLLEWVIYIITAIGLWRIAYATLRMENAKADKGGF